MLLEVRSPNAAMVIRNPRRGAREGACPPPQNGGVRSRTLRDRASHPASKSSASFAVDAIVCTYAAATTTLERTATTYLSLSLQGDVATQLIVKVTAVYTWLDADCLHA